MELENQDISKSWFVFTDAFIQYYEQDARLFFHYSEYAGKRENMRIGVERTGNCIFDGIKQKVNVLISALSEAHLKPV